MKALLTLVPLLLGVASCAPSRPLTVENVWARDTAGRTENAAVFMTIRSGTPDRLIGASTTRAGKTDLMTMRMAGGAMAMDYVAGIDVPADTAVSLDPAGLHVWLAKLRRPLKAGETFPLTLRFAKAGQREVKVSVIGLTASPPLSPAGK